MWLVFFLLLVSAMLLEKKNEMWRAWYLIARDRPATVLYKVWKGYKLRVGSVLPDWQCAHALFLHMQAEWIAERRNDCGDFGAECQFGG